MSDRDRRLAEAMGEAYHGKLCSMCYPGHCEHDFDNDGKKRLMDWAVEQEWWSYFEADMKYKWRKLWWEKSINEDFVTYLWRNLPSLVDEYRRGK